MSKDWAIPHHMISQGPTGTWAYLPNDGFTGDPLDCVNVADENDNLVGTFWFRHAAVIVEAVNLLKGDVSEAMIDRAAKAIYEANDPWAEALFWPDISTDKITAGDYRILARAALLAALHPNREE